MARRSQIEWTMATWNPTLGCTKTSPGCKHCYAETMARRLQAMAVPGYEGGFSPALLPARLEEPLRWRRPTRCFVGSMSDLFHDTTPFAYLERIFAVIGRCPQHTFQILTKRPERMAAFFHERAVPENAWIGVTVQNRAHGLPRIDLLRRTEAPVRFLSVEPLLEDLGTVDLCGIHWVIVGGESGPRARPMHPAWASSLRDQCTRQRIPFHFRQWGTWGSDGVRRNKKANGRLLAGRTWDEMPVRLGNVLPHPRCQTPTERRPR